MVERKQLIKRLALWVSVIGIMVTIFCFSAQSASQSQDLSDSLLYDILKFFGINASMEVVGFLSVFIRKAAHFTVYAVLGVLVYLLMRTGYGIRVKTCLVATVLICAVYAASDEIHQLMVPGRSGQVSDVVLDTLGAITGMLIVAGIGKYWARRRKHD